MKKQIGISVLLSVLSVAAFSQSALLTIEISADTLMMGNIIQVKYTLENSSSQIETPELEGLRIVSGPNYASSMSSVNGQVTQSVSLTFFLQPVDIGSAAIGSAYVKTENGILESQPINLIVLDNPDGQRVDYVKLKTIEVLEMGKDGKAIKKVKGKKRYKI